MCATFFCVPPVENPVNEQRLVLVSVLLAGTLEVVHFAAQNLYLLSNRERYKKNTPVTDLLRHYSQLTFLYKKIYIYISSFFTSSICFETKVISLLTVFLHNPHRICISWNYNKEWNRIIVYCTSTSSITL